MITLEEYLVRAKKELDEFEKFWKTKAQRSPEVYPDLHTYCDWVEQFEIWTDLYL